MTTEQVIWVLGEKNTCADKSIDWDSQFPNFADPDIVIVNLFSLTEQILQIIDKSKYQQAMNDLQDKFLNGGKLIFITAPFIEYSDPTIYSNYDLAPVQFHTINVSEANRIEFNDNNEFTSYLNEIGYFDFYLNGISGSHHLAYKLRTDQEKIPFQHIDKYDVKDKSGHRIGCSINIQNNNGIAIFLPPSSKLSTQESIAKILGSLGKTSDIEFIPDWTTKISLPTINEKILKIQELELQKNSLEQKIKHLESEKKEILNHMRLLYSKDIPLEDAVKQVLILLGFDDVKRVRNNDREDWVFEFKHEKQFKYGIIEVKGADARTKQQHIVQSSKWVDEHFDLDKEISKGIFIPNQYRIKEYPNSQNERSKFEPNELDYATMKSICIIPSFVLFETVKDILNGKKKSQKDFEKLISKTSGLLLKM